MNSSKSLPKLSIIVPVFNEARYLMSVLKQLSSTACLLEREWIFVDDGSTDSSVEILRSFSFSESTIIVEQANNRGKGAAIIAGLARVTGDFVMIQDADLEYDPADIPTLLGPLLANTADVVYGSRFNKGRNNALLLSYFGNRFLTTFHNAICGASFTDVETCYKIFRVELLRNMRLRSKRFGIELELTAYLSKLNIRIVELPISYYPRTKREGKKITWKDGIAGIAHIIRFNVLTTKAMAFHSIPVSCTGDRESLSV